MKGALEMKHKILVLGLVVSCLLGLTACGSEISYNTVEGSRYNPQKFTNEFISDYAKIFEDQLFEKWYLEGVTPDNFEQKEYFDVASSYSDSGTVTYDDEFYETCRSGYESWYKAINDIGFNSKETLATDVNITETTYYINKEGVLVVDATIQGTKHSALLEMYLKNTALPSDIGVTVNKSNSEKLENAGLNTLLGMGMAFAILIIISLIISLFPLLFGSGRKKKESDKEIAEKAMENTITQIADKEDLSSDAELVAVIAAAIAAYEGSASTDGFTVRSIRKVNSKWKNNR
jgi:sodium pump decarboxylase gamma subunit